MSNLQRITQKIWNVLYKIFPWAERHMLSFHQKQRQRFHIGWLHPDKSLADLKIHLNKEWGFGNHFVAWDDSSQVLSWRKLTSFDEQYHLRVYNDGEIRGHYEYTPESAPLKHFFEKGESAKRADFEKFLAGYFVTEKYSRHVEPDSTLADLDSEVIFSEKNK